MMNRGNFNSRRFRRETEQERAEKAQLKAHAIAEGVARKARRDLKWPKIEPDYMPEVWKQKYQEEHGETFSKSVDILKKMKGLSHEQAKEQLLDTLIKITFIETNLTVNGCQNKDELFANLQLAQGGEPTIPFACSQEVAEFCDSMPINFHKQAKRYRNTGVAGRRLVQELKTRLELGDIIDVENFEQIMAEHCKSNNENDELEIVSHQEAGSDYSSLWHLAKKIPGFEFDKTKRRILLTPQAHESISLNLPIFADTINSSHPTKLDFSRPISSFATNLYTCFPERTDMLTNSEDLSDFKMGLFGQTIASKPSVFHRSFTLAHGYISPNNIKQQVEAFIMEPTTLCFLNNLCTESSGSSFLYGNKSLRDFWTINKDEQYLKNQIIRRSIVKNRARVEDPVKTSTEVPKELEDGEFETE